MKFNWKTIRHAKWLAPVIAVALVAAMITGAVFAYTTWKTVTVNNTGTLTIHTNNVVSLQISPLTPTIDSSATQQFSVTSTWEDGSTGNGVSVAWSSDNAAAATINSSSGLATAVAPGTANITATYSGAGGPITATTVLTVTDTYDFSIDGVRATGSTSITATLSATGTLYAGDQFTANGYSTGTTKFSATDIGSSTITSWVVSNITGIPVGLTGVTINVTSASISHGNSGDITITMTATAPASGSVDLTGMQFTLAPGP